MGLVWEVKDFEDCLVGAVAHCSLPGVLRAAISRRVCVNGPEP